MIVRLPKTMFPTSLRFRSFARPSFLIAAGLLVLGVFDLHAEIVYRGIAFTGKRYRDGVGTEHLGSFGPPVINDRGQVGYRSIVYGTGLDSFHDDRIIMQVRRSVEVQARETQVLTPAQSTFGIAGRSLIAGSVVKNTQPTDVVLAAVLNGANSQSFNSFLAINREGQIAFSSATFVDSTITVLPPGAMAPTVTNFEDSFDTLFIAENGNYFGYLGADEDYDPNRFTGYDIPFGLYSRGRAAITGTSMGTATVVTDEAITGLFFGDMFSMQLIGLVGSAAAGLPIEATYASFSLPGVNNAEVISTNATVTSTPNIFNGIYNFGSTNKPGFFLGTGTVAPGTQGTFDTLSGSPWLSPRGNLVFVSTIADDPNIPGALFVGRVRNDEANLSGGAVQLLVAVNDVAPLDGRFSNVGGTSSDAIFETFSQPGVNNRGTVVFTGTVTGTNIDDTNNSGLWVVPAGPDNETREPELIVRTGDIIRVDGDPKEVILVGFNPFYGLNNRNEVVFSVSFSDATSGTIRAIVR